jgi:hypothetical protein
MSQATLGLGLVRNGAILLTTSLIWGTQISNTPYPRIALSTHVNMLQHGLLSIAAGLLLREHGLVGKMDDWQVWVVFIPHMYLWVLGIASVGNTFWGTNKFLTIVYPCLLFVNGSWRRRVMRRAGRLGRRCLWNVLLSVLGCWFLLGAFFRTSFSARLRNGNVGCCKGSCNCS